MTQWNMFIGSSCYTISPQREKNYQDSVGVVNVVAVSVLIEKIKHGWFDATIHREFVEQRNIR